MSQKQQLLPHWRRARHMTSADVTPISHAVICAELDAHAESGDQLEVAQKYLSWCEDAISVHRQHPLQIQDMQAHKPGLLESLVRCKAEYNALKRDASILINHIIDGVIRISDDQTNPATGRKSDQNTSYHNLPITRKATEPEMEQQRKLLKSMETEQAAAKDAIRIAELELLLAAAKKNSQKADELNRILIGLQGSVEMLERERREETAAMKLKQVETGTKEEEGKKEVKEGKKDLEPKALEPSTTPPTPSNDDDDTATTESSATTAVNDVAPPVSDLEDASSSSSSSSEEEEE